MLGLICPSTFAFLASAAALLLFVALPVSVQPRFRTHTRALRNAAPARAAAALQACMF